MHLVSLITDFVEEANLLQHMTASSGKNIGLKNILDCSPKGHPQVAGEGIEYTWANSKDNANSVSEDQTSEPSPFGHQPLDGQVRVDILNMKDIEKMCSGNEKITTNHSTGK
eukprot:15360580-Ditylum_brightwellii.AAC.1